MDELYKRECVTCKKGEDQVTLRKCAVCFRFYCEDDTYVMAGREFCSKNCARYNFFPDDEG